MAAIPVRHTGGAHAIFAASVGNLLEWYDFAVYASFAIYIGANFFPQSAPGTSLIKALLVFGLGFVIRPLGAVVIGLYGDRAGRKSALTLTILIMACGTAVIALTPSYAAVGIGAAWLLIGGRILQGFSAGGEIGNAAAYLVEHSPPHGKARFTAWLQASMGMSNILSALVAFAVTSWLSSEELLRWGWRVPFLIGLAILPVGLYLRRTLEETPEFCAHTARPRDDFMLQPLLDVLRDNSSSLLVGFAIAALWAVEVYVLLVYLPVFTQREFGFSASQSFGASLLENTLFVTGCFAFGIAADRFGPARVMFAGALSMSLGIVPLFGWLATTRSTAGLLAVFAVLGPLVASFVGVAPTLLSGLFPVAQRATGLSLLYNGAFALFGGFAPAVLTWLTAKGIGSGLAPAWYVAIAAMVSAVALFFVPKQNLDANRS